MPLIAFSQFALEWYRVFAARVQTAPTTAREGEVHLYVDAPGADPMMVRVTGPDAATAIARIDADNLRFHAIGSVYFELAKVYYITLPQRPEQFGTVTFGLDADHLYVLEIAFNVAEQLLNEIRKENGG